MAAAGAGGIVVLAVGAFLLIHRGGDQTAETTSPPPTPPVTARGPGAPGFPGGPGLRPGMKPGKSKGKGAQRNGGKATIAKLPGAKGGIFGNPPTATGANPALAGAAGSPARVAAAGPTGVPHRSDPFNVPWKQPQAPPYVFSQVNPLRVASADVQAPPPNNTEIREVPSRRVSGIMTGDGVYAILESGSDVEIVKPGSKTSDGYTVVAINGDSVRLQRKEGPVLYTQVVPLSDVGASPQTAAYGGGGYPGQMGGGGMMRPGMGGFTRPGMGGSNFGGKD